MDDTDIFNYIIAQETAYKQPIAINDRWQWSMADHILTSELYINGQLLNGKNDWTPVKNIILPILNLQHRTEDIEVKDVQIYVDDVDKHHLSFLVKKYHDDVFCIENDLETYFDDLNISRIDMGAGLSKKLNTPCPEVVPLQSIAFCDQTDLLSGPIGIKHYYSPDQLLDMEAVGWGDTTNGATISVPDLIKLSRDEKKQNKDARINKTPGRYIEVYEVHGNLPKRFADANDTSERYETRIYICAFYQKKLGDGKQGVILYTKKETESPFKLTKRDKVHGRALGRGGAEELFEDQVWTTSAQIHLQNMLEAASKTILKTTDPAVKRRHPSGLKNLKNLEIIEIDPNTELDQLDTFPRNASLFEKAIFDFNEHAKNMGGAQDPIQGEQPSAGTPFASLQAQIQQGLGIHQYRRGQYAKHLEEVYYEWIIPEIEKALASGAIFLSELSLDELQYVSQCVIRNQVNSFIKEEILAGRVVDPQQVDQLTQQLTQEFSQKGNKHFIEILKGEFKGVKLGVKVSIAGKSKDLAGMVDKLTNVFRTVIANPYILGAPPIAKLFNKIIEASGLDPIDLSQLNIPPMPARRMTEGVDYKDLIAPPNPTQVEFLKLAGIDVPQGAPPGTPQMGTPMQNGK